MRSRRSGRAREERLARTKGEFESRGVLKRLRLDGFGRLFRRLSRGLFGFPFVEKGEKRMCSDLQTMDSSNLTRKWVNTTPHLACLLLIGDRKRRESICFAFFDRRADLFIGCFWIGGARLWVAAVVLLSWRPKLGWERGRREGRLGGRRRKMEASFVFFLRVVVVVVVVFFSKINLFPSSLFLTLRPSLLTNSVLTKQSDKGAADAG